MEENASESCRLLQTRTSTQTRRKRQLYDNVGDVQNHGYRWRYDDYTTIDWSHDTIKDRIRHRKIRSSNTFHGFFYKHYDASQAWIVLIIVGLISGVLASLIDFSIQILEDIKRGYCSRQFPIRQEWCCLGKTDDCHWITWESIFGSEVAFGIYTILGVSMAMISCVLVINGPIHTLTSDENNHYLPEPISIIRLKNSKVVYDSAGSGIPEVKTILGGFVITGFLGFRTLATKIIGLIFAIASGLSIGVQGPLVHIACCVGNITTRIFQKYSMNEAKRREIMSAACAAGVSVAFGAPIGGVLFSLEEVSYYFPPKTMWRSFFCALIAAVTLKLIDPFGTGKLVRFQVTYDSDWNHWELLSFLFLGMIGGLYGALFTKVVMLIDRFKNMNNLNIYPMLEVCIVSLATSVLSFGNQFTWMSNVEFVTELLTECKGVILSKSLCQFDDIGELLWQLLFALAVNIFLMVITFGIKVPGGVFVPSMVVGACFGRIYGIALEYLINTGYLGDVGYKITPGVYALSGAAGVLGGVTRMTVIMFELTGGLTYILPIMASVMSSKWVADAIGRDSIYDAIISQKGYPYLNYKHNHLKTPSTAKLMMETKDTLDVDTIYNFKYLVNLCEKSDQMDEGYPILKNKSILIGYISHADLNHAINMIIANNETEPDIQSVVFHNMTLEQQQGEIEIEYENQDTSSIFYANSENGRVCSLGQWVDLAPFSISSECSSEMVVEIFTKLGIRTLLVTKDGSYVGVIQKKRMLSFIKK